jgi:hypothetical protein
VGVLLVGGGGAVGVLLVGGGGAVGVLLVGAAEGPWGCCCGGEV